MASKNSRTIVVSLASDTPSVSAAEWIEVGENGRLDIQAILHHEDDITAAPTGTPVGSWRLYCAGAQEIGGVAVTPVRITAAETGANSLADIAPNGNNLVNAVANFTDVPGTRCKVVYVFGSGGTDDKATLIVTRS